MLGSPRFLCVKGFGMVLSASELFIAFSVGSLGDSRFRSAFELACFLYKKILATIKFF